MGDDDDAYSFNFYRAANRRWLRLAKRHDEPDRKTKTKLRKIKNKATTTTRKKKIKAAKGDEEEEEGEGRE
jgi:hypothetical protein